MRDVGASSHEGLRYRTVYVQSIPRCNGCVSRNTWRTEVRGGSLHGGGNTVRRVCVFPDNVVGSNSQLESDVSRQPVKEQRTPRIFANIVGCRQVNASQPGSEWRARRRQSHTELIMTKERRDILDQGADAYITMPHYAYEYKCTLGVATINAAPPDL